MKSLIVPATIIVSLIVLFVIIDRNDFNSSNYIQPAQNESIVSSRNTASVSRTETNPAVSAKSSIETKPVVETKPAGMTDKQVEDLKPKPQAETNPVSENEGEEPILSLRPSAVSLLSQEEAIKANKEAIAYFDIFLKTLRAKDSDLNILEGKIKSISQCPNPQTIDYPDCNLTVSAILNDNDHTEIVLYVPCIRDSKIILSHCYKEDIIIRFRIMDDSEVSEDEKSIQTVDDISNFELDYFYVDYAIPINAFSGITKYIKNKSVKDRRNTQLILSDNDILKRKDYMNKELERLNQIIDSFSIEDAKAFKDNLHKIWGASEDTFPYIVVNCNDTDNKSKTKFYSLVFINDPTPARYVDSAFSLNNDRIFKNAQAIASIRDWLEEKGIHLIVIPVPQYPESFVDRFNLSNHLSSYNIDRIFLMKYLLEMDVETLDIEPQIEKSISSDYYYHNFPEGDCHFRSSGEYYFAQHIYDHLKQYEFLEKIIQNDYDSSLKWISYPTSYQDIAFGDMRDATIQSDVNAFTNDSPILLIGDSFSAYKTTRKSIAHVFNTRITAISRGGGSYVMAKVLQANEKSIPEKAKICFFVFYSMYLNRDYSFIAKPLSKSKENNLPQ